MIRVRAFAKINLSLAVLGLRPDGFHEIDSLVQTVDLADEIAIDLRGRDVTVRNDLEGLEGRDLAAVAAEALLPLKSGPSGVEIDVRKGIPAGAGLGGGSSDAAAVLVVLNRLLEPRLPTEHLARLAARLGSDVPLFLRGGLLRIHGRGEIVEPARPAVSERFLIVVPPIHCRTATVYERFDQTGRRVGIASGLGENALLRPALEAYPALRKYHRAIQSVRAEYSGMSGSGSSFFAAFSSGEALAEAGERLSSSLPEARCFCCEPTDVGQRVVEGMSA